MDNIILPSEDQRIIIKRKPNPRAKRLSLRVIPRQNSFILTIPPRTSEVSINLFLARCTPWINKNLNKITHVPQVQLGEEVILFGTPFKCTLDPLRRKPVLCKVTQTFRLPPEYTEKALHDFFKKMAADYLTPYVMTMAETLGKTIEKITFRDTKTRWGSCSAQKTISLNWRLILAPPEVAKYVCVHEVVHLLHMNHSQAFWKCVEALCPSYKSHRKWLKTHGYSLMKV